ncbi:MAG: Mannosyl transferase [Candidatus Amesbacteria bacterium GW2011_GWA2_42_12]|uniref:GDP-Man:Man(1)GlcNAc(2)-PP-Dol alpha-1,3-mannosyltransferase n=1 Tax=Candidatus Amesbacteria bacterium GW2011_GWA2_42_12 TaxID=1618356 RepID=A0A0G0Y8A2_9BACT|nr:MAG: Mannosyl transferase [Candidatus Amesbacteria bacterium GW2011_GWA2_42_12]
MKVAIVHDYLKEIGGAERVLMALKEIFPDAPVYTAYKFSRFWGEFREIGEKWDIRESWGKYLPFLPKFLSYYTILSPLFFRSFDLSDYDLVIVSQTGGYFPNGVKIGPKTKLVTYCHTPPRFLYGYETATKERNKWYWKPISAIVNHILLMVDFQFAQNPHLFIANSRNVAERIKKFYRRDSVVVCPPIEIPNPKSQDSNKLQNPNHKKDYYLVISRIVGSKGLELLYDFGERYKIKVAGRAINKSGEEIVQKLKENNIEYLGEVSEEDKWKLMTNAKGFLCLSRDEDFGISSVEAQMCGTLVIAYNSGGYKETVINKKTGILFDEYTTEGLIRAIREMEEIRWNKKYIINHAQKFSKENFVKQCRNYLK